jgi:flagellar basal body rod protein FlgC
VLQRSAPGCPAIVSYDSLPFNIRKKVDDKLRELGAISTVGHATVQGEAFKTCFFEPYVKEDPEALDYFTALFPGNFEKINQHYMNAKVLGALREVYGVRVSERHGRGKTGNKKDGLFGALIADLKELTGLEIHGRPKYPHTLPMSERNLRPLLKDFGERKYEALVHGNTGNTNTRKVTEKMEQLFLSIYCMKNKPYSSWVHEDYTDFMNGRIEIVDHVTGELLDNEDYKDENGEIVHVGEVTIWDYINKPANRIIVDSIRSNSHTFRHKYMPHHIRANAKHSLSKVTFDDRDLPRPLEGGGHVYAYYAYDVMSGKQIGAAYSLKKDEKLFLDCVRNMYHNLREWGLGMPLEVEVENHLTGKFRETLLKPGNLFERVTYCAPSNSQEKHAEQFNRIRKYCAEKRLQENIGRHYNRLEANKVEGARFYNEKTDEYEHKYKTYSYERLVEEDAAAGEYYNNHAHRDQKKYEGKTINEVFFGNVNPEAGKMDNHKVFYWLGEQERTSIDRNQYVNLQYAKYWLDSPAALERLLPNNYNVTAYWMRGCDGVAMDEAYIYQNGRFVCQVRNLQAFTTAKAEWTEADTTAKRAQDEYIKNTAEYVKTRKKKISGVEYAKIKDTVSNLGAKDDYAVNDAPAQEEGYVYDERDAEYYLERSRELAYTN